MIFARKTLTLAGLTALAFGLILVLTGGTVLADKMSCQKLAEIGEAIDNVGAAVEDEGLESIKPGSPTDKALRGLIADMRLLAASEGSAEMKKNLNLLEEAWAGMKAEQFQEVLDAVGNDYDQVYDRDCAKQ